MITTLIVLICILFFVYGLWNVNEYFENDIDSMSYGQIIDKWKTIAEREIKSFQLPLPLNNITPPPKNSSKKTLAELQYLSKLTNSVTQEKRAVALQFLPSDSVLKYFIKFAGENGLIYSDKHLTDANNDIETLCMKLKILYNRPRPAQLSFVKQITIDTVGVESTPSFPCCSSMKAKVIAGLLTYNNPKYKDQLEMIAKKIELSKLYGGLNYPSDNVAALEIADIILKKIRKLDTTVETSE